jgi:transglutaminase-like putative cysteine protease
LLISIHTHLVYSARQSCSLLLQIEAAQDGAQTIESATLTSEPNQDWTIISGEENIGLRRWTRVDDLFDCTYQTHVNVTRPAVVLETLDLTPYAMIPSDVTKFLMPSRYCFPEDFLDFAPQFFGHLTGGPLIAAMARWITDNFTYDNSASHAATTATDSFRARAGVCRDYAHVMIAMARSVGIPARFVSAYAPDVTPQDFHAVAEVYLDGAWHLIDPTGMAQAPEIVRIGVGRDAADVSFMTSYGWMELIKQAVHVARVD